MAFVRRECQALLSLDQLIKALVASGVIVIVFVFVVVVVASPVVGPSIQRSDDLTPLLAELVIASSPLIAVSVKKREE